MNKIAVLIDALNFRPEMLNFAAHIAGAGRSTLVGLFCEEPKLDVIPSMKAIGGQVFVEEIVQDKEAHKEREATIAKNMELFRAACLQQEIPALVRRITGEAGTKIIEESRYADLIVTNPSFSLTGDEKTPSGLVSELLNRAECPVLISPEHFERINEVILAFDGSASSVFAIKQFFYQLPGFAEKKIIVLHINENDTATDERKAENDQFKEWLDMHFSNITLVQQAGDARAALFNYFMEQNEPEKKMLVMGAFGRGLLSTFFKPRTADILLKAADVPLFIAHH
jgi:hypothetical protein